MFRGVDGDIYSNEFCYTRTNATPTWTCPGDVGHVNKLCQSSSQQFFDRAVRGIDQVIIIIVIIIIFIVIITIIISIIIMILIIIIIIIIIILYWTQGFPFVRP